MIDIHVITLPNTNPDWLSQCLKSLEHPSVTVHMIDGIEGHIGKGRAAGYQQGSNPFLAYIDPDDYLLEGAIDCILPWLKRFHAITTREIILTEAGEDAGKRRIGHQLTVYKRDLVTPKLLYCMSQTSYASEMFVKQAIQPTPLPLLTYAYRVRSDSARTQHSPRLSVECKQWLDAEQSWGGQ